MSMSLPTRRSSGAIGASLRAASAVACLRLVSTPVLAGARSGSIEIHGSSNLHDFDAEHFPRIEARSADIEPSAVEQGDPVRFALRIRDIDKPVSARASHWRREGDTTRFDVTFDVLLRDFDLEAPSVLFLQVEDRVDVEVHVTLDDEPAQAG